jgi:hypothetical protein
MDRIEFLKPVIALSSLPPMPPPKVEWVHSPGCPESCEHHGRHQRTSRCSSHGCRPIPEAPNG